MRVCGSMTVYEGYMWCGSVMYDQFIVGFGLLMGFLHNK